MEIVLGLGAAVVCLAIWVLWSAQSDHERFMKELDMALPPPAPTPSPTPTPTPTPTPITSPKKP